MLRYLFLSFYLIFLLPLQAQDVDEKFGKNRVQFREFDWKYIVSDNFEVYYYGEGVAIAEEATKYLESNFDRITDLMGYPPYSKTKIFIYNSQTDLRQSNVGINYQGAISGGETQFVKSSIEIAHPGTLIEFKDELIHKVTELLLNEMLYGGSLRDMLQSNLMNLPEWLTEGAALYIAKGWSIEMDDYIRQYLSENRRVKLHRLSGKEAALAGQSVWNFIAERHGKSNISNILNYIKIIRNEEKSVAITLGIPFRELMIDWKRFYTEMDNKILDGYVRFSSENLYTDKNRKSVVIKNVEFSPDGMRFAWTTNDMGRYKLMIYDIATDEEVTVLKGGSKVVNQDINTNLPLMSWVDDNTLGYIDSRNGKNTFWMYDVVSHSKIPRVFEYITEVKSLDFNGNGRLGVISATVNGHNDLYLFSTRRNQLKRLTDDIYDDIDPKFVPNSNVIVFSSNRTSDTLNLPVNNFDVISDNFNIFYYNLDTTKNIVKRVTNTLGQDTKPVPINSNEIIYLSDQRGIKNLFKYELNTGIYSQLTNYRTSIKEYDYNHQTLSLVFIALRETRDHIYFRTEFNIDQQNFSPSTPRQQIMQARMLKKRVEQRKTEYEGLSMKGILDKKLEEVEPEKEEELINLDTTKVNVPVDILDTDNYTFEEEVKKEEEKKLDNDFLAKYRNVDRELSLSGPNDYETLFSADKIITTLTRDPLRGLGLILTTTMNGMLDNHTFEGGVIAFPDLRSGDIWGEYNNYKGRIDYGIRFDRKTLYWDKRNDLQIERDKYNLTQIELKASYALDAKQRFDFKPFFVNNTYHDLGELNPNGLPTSNPRPVFGPSVSRNYLGGTIQYVFDNSVVLGMNIKEGTKGKIRLMHYERLGNSAESFSNLTIDFRHYQKIHREITFASRIFLGKFFGRDPKSYALGGMDNWLFPRINQSGNNNPISQERMGDRSDIMFVDFITPIRGFEIAELYGSDVLAFSSELRIPLVKYLNSGYIASNFFRNIQLVGFFDIGSAWSGFSPFNPENTITTEELDPVGAFEITLKNFRNPYIMSYGVGFRSMILGYYTKFDLAWPVIDLGPETPRLSITLGFDF